MRISDERLAIGLASKGTALDAEEIDSVLQELFERRQSDPQPVTHLWSDEQVAELKAQGVIVENTSVPAPTGKCDWCGAPVEVDGTICDRCIPF